MLYTLKNEYLTVEIHKKGATLWSVRDRNNNEYLWQGDINYWQDRAPNLFPYIARMTKGKYTLKGKTYKMDIHGFAKDMTFYGKQIADNHVIFTIKNSQETYKQYPYKFNFSIIYKLEKAKLSIKYWVNNNDEKTMYFGIGGHPGFNVPFEENTLFEDYYLQFASVCNVKRVVFSDDCFVTEETSAFSLEDGKRLSLKHSLFDDDAIVLKDMAKSVTLLSKKGNKGICVTYPDMSYLGIWHMPKTDAPYICIEPWSSLPSRKGIVENLEKQPGLVSLESGCEYENRWSIEIIENSNN